MRFEWGDRFPRQAILELDNEWSIFYKDTATGVVVKIIVAGYSPGGSKLKSVSFLYPAVFLAELDVFLLKNPTKIKLTIYTSEALDNRLVKTQPKTPISPSLDGSRATSGSPNAEPPHQNSN